ncbi:MAG: lipoyl(octanoyl) transferase LipB [Bacteroidia bacterium]|jgi:lipoyl(octanoyl) transferase
MISVQLIDLGVQDYKEVWDLQEQYFKESIDLKIANKSNQTHILPKNRLLFVEHPPVYTLGKSGKKENLLLQEDQLKDIGATFYAINRGGDITFHGPGQLVVYPLLDLEQFIPSLNAFVTSLEKCVIDVCQYYGIRAEAFEGYTGVWIEPGVEGKERKICAIGLKSSRWCTMHGIAFNINTSLDFFNYMIPCGIDDKAVTSLKKELGKDVDMAEVKNLFLQAFLKEFNAQIIS